MKIDPQYTIIASVILIVIFFMMYAGTKTFTPYDAATIFSHQYPYEGFESIHHSMDYINTKTNQGDKYTSFLMNGGSDLDCKKVYGFDGLFCNPKSAEQKIDIYSDIKGSASCIGKSSGLTNSKGGLCLDKIQTDMLLTRGGNQTVMESQIGN